MVNINEHGSKTGQTNNCSKKKKKKRMQESLFERGKEEGNMALEKVRNRRCIIGLRT